jgi:type II secretory pathway pseudopilin PulG
MDFEHDVPVAPEIDAAEQFKATFDQVKADLAAFWSSPDHEPWFPDQNDDAVCESPPISPKSFDSKFSRLPSRSQIIQAKIRDLDSKILASQSQLDSDMRCVRNIAILTPFQKSTRTKLLSAIQGMAKRVVLLRLELEKLKCYRAVLRCDLTSQGRTWHRSKQMALRAAKETLQSRRAHSIPTMRLSLPNDLPASSTDPQFPTTPSSQGPESSICGSFYSAIDIGFDWPFANDTTFLTTGYDSTKRSLSTSTPSFQVTRDELDGSENLRRSTSMSSHPNQVHAEHTEAHENDNISQGDEEQAEEWNRTRCAHRVSLIRVPPDIRMLKKPIGS